MACGQTPLDLIECEVYTVGSARQLISCRLTAYITWDYIRAAARQTQGSHVRRLGDLEKEKEKFVHVLLIAPDFTPVTVCFLLQT